MCNRQILTDLKEEKGRSYEISAEPALHRYTYDETYHATLEPTVVSFLSTTCPKRSKRSRTVYIATEVTL